MKLASYSRRGRLHAGHLVASLFLFAALQASGKDNSAYYSIRDTGHGFSILHSTIQPIFWLDEDRILYRGYEPSGNEVRGADGKTTSKLGVYVLDVRTNRNTRHADLYGYLCYRDGFVRYFARSDPTLQTQVWREGRFGEEKEVIYEGRPKIRGLRISGLTCRDYQAGVYGDYEGLRIPLLDQHGSIEYGRRKGPGSKEELPPRWLSSDGGTQVALPFTTVGISPSWIRYYEFANVYTIGYAPPQQSSSKWSASSQHRIYVLSTAGKVSEISISGGGWGEQRLSAFALTLAGVLVYGGELRRYKDPGTVGIYLVSGGTSRKISSGLLHALGVSPSGCRVAVAMQTYVKSPDPALIRIVELCGGGGNDKR
jgi:hypothetical protein